MSDIKSMKLYTHVERIYRELGELGKTIDDPLSVDEPTLTISATFTPRRAYLYWYHWRLRLSRRIAGQDRLLRRKREAS